MSSGVLQETAWEITQHLAAIPAVEAVCLGGSFSSGRNDQYSDIDLYVYTRNSLDYSERAALADRLGQQAIIGHRFWEEGDYWVHRNSGIEVDIMYRSLDWISAEVFSVMKDYQAATGYTTALCYNVAHSAVLFERNNVFRQVQEMAQQPYPPQLQSAVWEKNYPILAEFPFSFVHQIELALARQDMCSVQHRLSAYCSSFFDALFALNAQLHPGEKRLLQHAQTLCRFLPERLEERVKKVFQIYSTAPAGTVDELKELAGDLDLCRGRAVKMSLFPGGSHARA